MTSRRPRALLLSVVLFSVALIMGSAFAEGTSSGEVVLYSGRSKSLVGPVIQHFEKETGITVKIRYGNTAQLALTIQEEGEMSPADVFWAQDAGALGALSKAGVLTRLPDSVLETVPERFRSGSSNWVATSGRARVLAYSPSRVDAKDLPDSVFELSEPKWRGRVGWSPVNASFQSFVTSMRVQHGTERTRAWLKAMKANGAKAYPKNTPILEAIAAGEIDLGLPNHYYLMRFKAADANFPVEQRFFAAGDAGNLVNVAGAGILGTSRNSLPALQLVKFFLSPWAQQYFASEVYEYPVIASVSPNARLATFEELQSVMPAVDLEDLDDLRSTLALLTEVGLI